MTAFREKKSYAYMKDQLKGAKGYKRGPEGSDDYIFPGDPEYKEKISSVAAVPLEGIDPEIHDDKGQVYVPRVAGN